MRMRRLSAIRSMQVDFLFQARSALECKLSFEWVGRVEVRQLIDIWGWERFKFWIQKEKDKVHTKSIYHDLQETSQNNLISLQITNVQFIINNVVIIHHQCSHY
jgi:hypothetical protein